MFSFCGVFESDEVTSTLVEDDSGIALSGLKSSPNCSKLSHFVVKGYCTLFGPQPEGEPSEERKPNLLIREETVVDAIPSVLAMW